MKEPKRLLDAGAGELSLALLRAGDAERPRDEARRAAMAAVGLTTGVPVPMSAGTSGTAGGIATLRIASWKWWLLGAVGSASIAGGGYWAASRTERPIRTAVRSVSPVSAEPVPAAEGAPSALPPAPPDDASPTAAERALPNTVAPRPPPASSGARIEEQIEIIDRARSAAASGQPRASLAVLDEYQKRYPNGILAQEATLLRVESLLALGDRTTATRLGKVFLAQHPRSALASRVRNLVEAGN